jgi:hypothetical protein
MKKKIEKKLKIKKRLKKYQKEMKQKNKTLFFYFARLSLAILIF